AGVVLRLLAYVEENELRVVELRREPVARDEEIAARELAVLRLGGGHDWADECDGGQHCRRTACERAKRVRHVEFLVVGHSGAGGQVMTARGMTLHEASRAQAEELFFVGRRC